MDNEFSVVQFFEDGSYEYVRRFVNAEEAVQVTKHLTIKVGFVNRVIITDGGDCCCFEWLRGKGVVFPAKDDDNDRKDSNNS